MKRVISTTAAPGAVGPYSQAVEANGFVFVSGQLHQSRARRTERSPGSAPISAIYMVGGVFVLVCPLDAEE